MPKLKPTPKVKSTVPFKLKDKNDRWFRTFDLESQFGFLPTKIVIAKLQGKNNTLVLGAFLTKEQIAKEKEIEKSKEIPKAKPIK